MCRNGACCPRGCLPSTALHIMSTTSRAARQLCMTRRHALAALAAELRACRVRSSCPSSPRRCMLLSHTLHHTVWQVLPRLPGSPPRLPAVLNMPAAALLALHAPPPPWPFTASTASFACTQISQCPPPKLHAHKHAQLHSLQSTCCVFVHTECVARSTACAPVPAHPCRSHPPTLT